MADSLGLTAVETQALNNLVAGPVETMKLPCEIGITPKVGQVLEYDSTSHQFQNFTAYSEGNILAIFADRVLHVAAGTATAEVKYATCIVAGRVNLTALDAVAVADADIVAALLQNRIFAETAILA